jgi:hypothetical protein
VKGPFEVPNLRKPARAQKLLGIERIKYLKEESEFYCKKQLFCAYFEIY